MASLGRRGPFKSLVLAYATKEERREVNPPLPPTTIWAKFKENHRRRLD